MAETASHQDGQTSLQIGSRKGQTSWWDSNPFTPTLKATKRKGHLGGKSKKLGCLLQLWIW